MSRVTDAQRQLFVTRYIAGDSTYQIAKDFNLSIKPIYNALHKAGIITNRQRKYTVNDTYFSLIDTEDKAYWLGFILADGTIQSNLNKIHLYLSIKDINHINKYKYYTGNTSPISETKIKCGITISSKQWIKDLAKFNISDRKSLTLNPNLVQINKQLIVHFWRGVVDGDGSIALANKKYPHNYEIGIVGTFQTCKLFADWIYEITQIKCHPNPHSAIWETTVSGRLQVRKIAEILYKNSTIFLDRKMKQAQLLLESPNYNVRHKKTFIRS